MVARRFCVRERAWGWWDMPVLPESFWVQFPLVALFFVMTAALAVALYRLFNRIMDRQDKQIEAIPTALATLTGVVGEVRDSLRELVGEVKAGQAAQREGHQSLREGQVGIREGARELQSTVKDGNRELRDELRNITTLVVRREEREAGRRTPAESD